MVKKNNFWTHKSASLVKSGFRIGAGVSVLLGSFASAGLLFIIAEIFGIIEEMV